MQTKARLAVRYEPPAEPESNQIRGRQTEQV